MKQSVLRLFWILACMHYGALYADSAIEQTSRSFLYPRPLNHFIQGTSFIWQDIVGNHLNDNHTVLRLMPIYQQSRDHEKTARYFLLNCQDTIMVAGDDTTAAKTRDVRAEYLGLPKDFMGTYHLSPDHRQGGCVISCVHDLSHYADWNWLNNVWVIVSMPIIAVSQNIKPSQYILQSGTPDPTGPKDLLEAFNQPGYRFGRMADCRFTRCSPSELDIGIGATWISKHGFLLWYQSTFDIPTGPRTPAQYLWVPTIGINGHVGWSNELAFSVPLQPEDSLHEVRLVGNMASHYLFSRSQERVFDLRHKPWSRYLPLVNRRTGEVVPALNVLSRYVEVHPRNFVNISGGLMYEYCQWYAQLGYALWVHRTEKIEFLQNGCSSNAGTNCSITEWGIAAANASSTNIQTASRSTIYEQATADPVFEPLHLTDIDLWSGASHEAFTQGLHLECGYRGEWGYGAAGVTVEQAHKNSALNLWVVWATAGVEF